MERIGVLLGAGVSGPPSTNDLTQIVLDGENVHRYSDGTYFVSQQDHPGIQDADGIDRIRDCLAFLQDHTNRFYAENEERVANYEDLYYVVSQLADAQDEFENPAVAHLLREARRRFLDPPLPVGSSIDATNAVP